MFLALGFAAQGSVYASPLLWLGTLLALWAGFSFIPTTATGALLTPLAACVIGFALWMLGTNLAVNPAYTAQVPYQAAFLFGGFLLGRRVGAENARMAFRTAFAFALVLAAWAIWQQVAQHEARAHGPFETPATLASTINLLLAPGLVLVALSTRRALLIAPLVILSAALVAAQSRGGWLALMAAGVIAFMFIRRAGIRLDAKAAVNVVGILALGWGVAAIAWLGGNSAAGHSMIGDDATQSSIARLDLYELALNGISGFSWVFGSGYHSFHYLLESARPTIPDFRESTTYFVHDDYLQTLLELGLPGFAGLLLIVVLPLRQAWRAIPRLADMRNEQVVLVTSIAALSSMAVHALVDFPFYIPVCVLTYGVGLGLVDAILLRAACVQPLQLPKAANVTLRRAGVAAAGTIAAWMLAMPAAAEAASAYAERQWRAAKNESAAVWFEAARRLDPCDWRYHWYAGQFWLAEAQASRKAAAARLADSAFAAGYAANPREVRALYGRIVTQRTLRNLLDAPADPATLRGWADRAVALAPLDPEVRAERARVLAQFGAPSRGHAK